MARSALALIALVSLATGCKPGICARGSDCASGLVCNVSGACVLPPADAAIDGPPGEQIIITPIGDASFDGLDDIPGDADVDAPDDAVP
ncbi:MAG TPA: hypothetical protein VFK02_02525 [Kofleriaceae bacterium]|nr:hypothetical protein [Kofleriaceae bacterium]